MEGDDIFSFDFIILFIGFSFTLVVIGVVTAQRNLISGKLFGEFLIINVLYALYLLILMVLNYVKFYQSYQNAYWQTTEVWCMGIAFIAFLGWRMPFLTALFLSIHPGRRMRIVFRAGFALSLLTLLIGYFFMKDSEFFEIFAASGPLIFFISSAVFTLVNGSSNLPKSHVPRYILLLFLPLVLLSSSIVIDAAFFIFPFILYPFTFIFFQLSFLVLIRINRREVPSVEMDDFLKELAESFGISPRETELTALLLRGMSKKEIAQTLFISPNTVKTHTANIYRKLEITSRNELFALFYSKKKKLHPKGES